MKGFVLGIIVTLLVIVIGAYVYFGQGMAPVATSAPPMPFEKKFANMGLKARIRKEMPKDVPVQVNEPNMLAGAHTYMEHCAVCHGTPNQEQSAIAKGEFPKPPHLFKQHGDHVGVSDDPPGATYWVIANGIRLTGMPGFKGNISDNDIWQTAILLANADKLPDSVKTALVPSAPAAIATQAPASANPAEHK